MARPSKCPTELRERAARMLMECRQDYPHESAAIRSVASKLGIASTESLRQAEIDGGLRAGKTRKEIAGVRALKKEVAELRRANEIRKNCGGPSVTAICGAGPADLNYYLVGGQWSGSAAAPRSPGCEAIASYTLQL